MQEKNFLATTYQSCYKRLGSFFPPVKYKDFSSFYPGHVHKQPPRQFPIEPISPKRNLHMEPPTGPVLGLGTKGMSVERFLDPKPILRTQAPHHIQHRISRNNGRDARKFPEVLQADKNHIFTTKFGKMDMNLVNSLLHSVAWKTTSKIASDEYALPVIETIPPITTMERKSDAVSLKAKKYEDKSMDWQQCVFWDCVQTRSPTDEAVSPEEIQGTRRKNVMSNKLRRVDKGVPAVSSRVIMLSKRDNLSKVYVRQCPGYAGYIPNSIPQCDLEKLPANPGMTSIKHASYRESPVKEYMILDNARKGPFSKQVTLTYPYNPYNKIVEEQTFLQTSE